VSHAVFSGNLCQEVNKMNDENSVPNTILVSRKELRQVLKTLALSAKGKSPPHLVVYCGVNSLYLRVGASECKIEGIGYFDGQGYLPGKIVSKLLLVDMDQDPIPFGRLPEHLCIGNLRLLCQWKQLSTSRLATWMNATFMDHLSLEQRYSKEQIQESGMWPVVEAAVKDRDQRIAKAYELLQPMGVKLEDLRNLVILAIKQYAEAG
jgi:hypothetical protein